MENIDFDINKDNLKNIDIDMAILENIDIDIDIDMAILENIDIDIDKGILQNVDIDKISYRLEFGISNTPTVLLHPLHWCPTTLLTCNGSFYYNMFCELNSQHT